MSVRPHVLILSPAILEELARVLDYPGLRQFHKLGDERIGAFIANLQRQSLVLDPPGDAGRIMDDPADAAVVAVAVAGQASVICTLDRHFYQGNVRAYCRERMIEIVDDIELLRGLRVVESGRG